MKREEKNHQSRQKILESAMKEFGEQGYGLSSINTICSEGGISKGILYHYYKDRDELYLDCVKEVFDSLAGLLEDGTMPEGGTMPEEGTMPEGGTMPEEGAMPKGTDTADGLTEEGFIEERIKWYFDVRMAFFREYPVYQKIFCEAIVSPPQHLREAIEGIKEEFDRLNVDILTSLLRQVKLCAGTTVEEVVEVFRLYQDFASARYQMDRDRGTGGPETYEEICRKSINVLLYGVIEREGDCHE